MIRAVLLLVVGITCYVATDVHDYVEFAPGRDPVHERGKGSAQVLVI